jgi:hypothetical protein
MYIITNYYYGGNFMGLGSHILWYNHPAKEWVEALPLGNGSLGAMVYGGADKETVSLNLDTLWTGYSFWAYQSVLIFRPLQTIGCMP